MPAFSRHANFQLWFQKTTTYKQVLQLFLMFEIPISHLFSDAIVIDDDSLTQIPVAHIVCIIIPSRTFPLFIAVFTNFIYSDFDNSLFSGKNISFCNLNVLNLSSYQQKNSKNDYLQPKNELILLVL